MVVVVVVVGRSSTRVDGTRQGVAQDASAASEHATCQNKKKAVRVPRCRDRVPIVRVSRSFRCQRESTESSRSLHLFPQSRDAARVSSKYP